MKKIIILFIVVSYYSFSQDKEFDLENFTERLFQLQEDPLISYENLYESLLLHYSEKIDLNKANQSELGALYILTPLQVSSFLAYRNKTGIFLSVNELYLINGFDNQTVLELLPFITIKKDESIKKTMIK